MMKKKYWKILGYESTDEINEFKIPIGQITENKLCEFLRVLVLKHSSLSNGELIGGFLKKNAKGYNPLLEVHKDVQNKMYMCGSDIHFVAKAE